MNSASIAAAAAASSQAQVQMALAAKLTKANAEAAQAVVALLEAGSENLQQVSRGSLSPGVGGNLDVSA